MEQISRLNGMLDITIAYTTSESIMLRPPVWKFADLQVGTVIAMLFLQCLPYTRKRVQIYAIFSTPTPFKIRFCANLRKIKELAVK